MAEARIEIPYPTIEVMLRVGGEELPLDYGVSLPAVPEQGDIIEHHSERFRVLRREFVLGGWPCDLERAPMLILERMAA